MAALFLLALALIAWQAPLTRPVPMAPLSLAWTGGEQAFPIAAPLWGTPADFSAVSAGSAGSAEPAARYWMLRRHSALWPRAAEGGRCEVFFRTASSVWVRRGLDPRLLPGPEIISESGRRGGREALYFAAQDFLDDDDGNGDVLDPGELTRSGSGAEAEVFCPPPAGEEEP